MNRPSLTALSLLLLAAAPLSSQSMSHDPDQKAEGGALRFVVIESLGRAALREVPEALVRETIAAHGA